MQVEISCPAKKIFYRYNRINTFFSYRLIQWNLDLVKGLERIC